MSHRKVSFVTGEFYHVYNRGNSKQDIFKDQSDYRRLQLLLYVANSTIPFVFRDFEGEDIVDFERGAAQVHIGAYCFMPNHFHILLTPAVENGAQRFMQKLSTSYSMYFNRKHERTGSLFEGKFKAQHVAEDRYLKYLFAYIHLNPVKLIQSDWKDSGITNLSACRAYLERYPYSSLPDYLGTREEAKILETSVFPNYFKEKTELDAEMLSWLTLGKKT